MTIAVKQAAFHIPGGTVELKLNPYSTTVPDCDIYVSLVFFLAQVVLNILHSPVVSPDKMVIIPAQFNIELFKLLQMDVVREFLTHCTVYDGRKIALMIKKLPANEKIFWRCINRTCWLQLVTEMVGTVHGSVGPQ